MTLKDQNFFLSLPNIPKNDLFLRGIFADVSLSL
jgi:hypothetical protein